MESAAFRRSDAQIHPPTHSSSGGSSLFKRRRKIAGAAGRIKKGGNRYTTTNPKRREKGIKKNLLNKRSTFAGAPAPTTTSSWQKREEEEDHQLSSVPQSLATLSTVNTIKKIYPPSPFSSLGFTITITTTHSWAQCGYHPFSVYFRLFPSKCL